LETAVRELTALCDIIIISGGSSQGEKDFTAMIIDRIAKPGVFTHGLALKPGKPTILGWDEDTKTLLIGLPGHPVSAIMVFELLLSSANRRLENHFHSIEAYVSCNVPGTPGRAVCLPVTLELKDDMYFAFPIFGKAGLISTLTRADGFIIIDMNKEGLKKDESVLVHLF
jgi:molybdopterin molybdotransferase